MKYFILVESNVKIKLKMLVETRIKFKRIQPNQRLIRFKFEYKYMQSCLVFSKKHTNKNTRINEKKRFKQDHLMFISKVI